MIKFRLNKVISLKLASMILFWFGVIATFFIWLGIAGEYGRSGYIERLTPPEPSFFIFNILDFSWTAFAHIAHIIAGYFVARGNKTGFFFGIVISLYETVAFIVLFPEEVLSPFGVAVRIIFAFVLFLLIYKRKELSSLQSSSWRPWKNPTKI